MLYGTILCGFDSLTFGASAEVGAHAGLGYPEHLPDLLTSTGEEWAVLNKGVSGQTIRQIADRAPGTVRELLAYPGPRWAVVLAGTNDAKHPGVPIAEWEVLYRQVCAWARRASVPLALCTFPPVDGAAMPTFGPRAKAWLDAASERVRVLARQWDGNPTTVVVVELADLPATALCDGVHLSPVAYRAVAGRIADALRFSPQRPWDELFAEARTWYAATDATRAGPGTDGAEPCVADPPRAKRGPRLRRALAAGVEA